jgi:hypothetical protein
MKVWTKAEKESASVIVALTYKSKGVRVVSQAVSFKVSSLTNRQFNAFIKIVEGARVTSTVDVRARKKTGKLIDHIENI